MAGERSSLRITALRRRALEVPLEVPFVIATATMTTTLAWLLELEVEASGVRVVGLGEVATLPPVTVTLASLEESFAEVERALVGRMVSDSLAWPLPELARDAPVLRAALESAWLDARGRLEGKSAAAMLVGLPSIAARRHVTDITLPIGAPDEVRVLAERYLARGFSIFKVKVGKDVANDVEVLAALPRATADGALVRVRVDANGGYSARDAIRFVEEATARGVVLDAFEQPCARADHDGNVEVTRALAVPTVADESFRDHEDLDRILRTGAARGVNLKLVKHGGPLAAYELGARAQREGLSVMAGAMVETRLGLSSMLAVVEALAGVDFVDLDTAFLLTDEPFEGGYDVAGDVITRVDEPGVAVRFRR